jgi:hypothetical protein
VVIISGLGQLARRGYVVRHIVVPISRWAS